MTAVQDTVRPDDEGLARRLREATDPASRGAVADEIVRCYERNLRAYCRRRFAPDLRAADEAFVEILTDAWISLRDGNQPGHPGKWLFGIAERRCDPGWRLRRKAAPGPEPRLKPDAGTLWWHRRRTRRLEEAEAEYAARREQAVALADSIARTMPRERQRLHELHVFRGLSGARLAAELGLSSEEAYTGSQNHCRELAREFRINVPARDPGNRTACKQLAHPARTPSGADGHLRGGSRP
ncbi:RNA polymerase sigma factor [Streptomyces abikoensis]